MAVSVAISITQNSQNITNNTSNVTVKLTASWTGGSWNHLGTGKGWLKIDGTSYNFTVYKLNPNKTSSGSQTLLTKTVNITHSSNGTKTLSCSASFATGIDSQGTKTASASKTLTTIPRKSTLSVGNGTLNTSQTLTVTRKSTSFTHTIVAKCGSASTTVCTKSTSTSISFKPPLSWASQNTTGTSVSVTYTITTYSGSTSVGSNSYTKTCSIPSSVKPSCSLSVTDATGCLSKYGKYVTGQSKFKVTVTGTQSYGSAIASYKATANGKTYTSSSFTTGVVSATNTASITASVTDKRGRTSDTKSASVSIYNYSAPNISRLVVGRCDSDGTANDKGAYVKVTFSYSITALDAKNSASCKLEYKKSSATEYTTPSDWDTLYRVYSVTDRSYIFEADTESSYDVKLSITDDFETKTLTTSASTGFTLIHFKKSGRGMAIGKVSEDDDVFDVGMSLRVRGELIIDSDWIDLTIASGFKAYGDEAKNRPQYKVSGNTVTIRGIIEPTVASTPEYTNTPIASGLPTQLRPPIGLSFVCQGSQMNRWTCTVRPDGTLGIERYGTTTPTALIVGSGTSKGTWLPFCVTYQI